MTNLYLLLLPTPFHSFPTSPSSRINNNSVMEMQTREHIIMLWNENEGTISRTVSPAWETPFLPCMERRYKYVIPQSNRNTLLSCQILIVFFVSPSLSVDSLPSSFITKHEWMNARVCASHSLTHPTLSLDWSLSVSLVLLGMKSRPLEPRF